MSLQTLTRLVNPTRVSLYQIFARQTNRCIGYSANQRLLGAVLMNNSAQRYFSDKPTFKKTKPDVQIPDKIDHLAEQLANLSVAESAMLFESLKHKVGLPDVSMSSMLSFGAGGGGGGGGGGGAAAAAPAPVEEEAPKAKEPEKTSFTVKLVSFDEAAKFKVLKEIRVLKPGMQLMESKALIEKLPSVLKEDVSKEEGDKWIEQLKAAGAVVELA